MHNVEMESVHVCLSIKGIRTKVADQNAFSVVNVLNIWLAFVISVEIHVLEPVDLELTVTFTITFQYVVAQMVTVVVHSFSVSLFLVCIESMLFFII